MFGTTFNSLRKRGTTRDGNIFPPSTIAAVWNKAAAVPGYDPTKFRKDSCGAWISYTDYGKTNSAHGWEIDHIRPVSKGGDDNITNLQPLQWENNRGKSDDWPHWNCSVSAVNK